MLRLSALNTGNGYNFVLCFCPYYPIRTYPQLDRATSSRSPHSIKGTIFIQDFTKMRGASIKRGKCGGITH